MGVIEAIVYTITALLLIGLVLGTIASVLSGAINFGWKYAPLILLILIIALIFI